MILPKPPLQPITVLQGQTNGRLDPNILTTFPGQAGGSAITLVPPAARAFKALIAEAKKAGHILKTDSPAHSYRDYDAQVATFKARYVPYFTRHDDGHIAYRIWNGKRWYHKTGPVVAVPGTSNHGLARVVDMGEEADTDRWAEMFDPATLDWLIANSRRFGIAWELDSEPWHIRYFMGDIPPQAVLDYEASLKPNPLEDDVTTIVYATGKATVLVDPGNKLWQPIASNSDVALYEKIGVPKKSLTPAEWERLEDLTRG